MDAWTIITVSELNREVLARASRNRALDADRRRHTGVPEAGVTRCVSGATYIDVRLVVAMRPSGRGGVACAKFSDFTPILIEIFAP